MLLEEILSRNKVASSSQLSKLVAISSPHGSTGKSTLAANLSLEIAAEGNSVLLVDLDVLGPALANIFGLTYLPGGVSGSLRLAVLNRLDENELKKLLVEIPKTRVSVLPASGNLMNREELSVAAIRLLIDTASKSFDYIVLDLPALPNFIDPLNTIHQITQDLVSGCDVFLLLAAADQVGIHRLLAVESLAISLGKEPTLIINRLRNSVLAGARREIQETLLKLGSLPIALFLPDEASSHDQALRDGRPVSLGSRSSAYKQALMAFTRTSILGRRGVLDNRVAKL
jgi:MinD-like ATPase involved in chromosome partitioning or flagellar assembly